MQVNGMFMGAYYERIVRKQPEFKEISATRREEISSKLSLAFSEMKKLKTTSATVSLSKETKDFLCSEEGYIKMKSDIEELYAKNAMRQKELSENNRNDVFWTNTGNQWMIFSESLYENGFYDGMSDDEVKEAENTLAKITAGMDHLSRIQYNTGMEFSDFYGHGVNFFMDSNEVNLELESATGALKLYADKYVPENQKESFYALIDIFYSHNMEIIAGYQSPVESFNRAVYGMQKGKYANSAVNNTLASDLQKSSANNIEVIAYLGGINHTSEGKADYLNEMKDFFEQMRKENGYNSEIWSKVKNSYVDYASNKSDDKRIREYVSKQATYTFSRIEGYWKELI